MTLSVSQPLGLKLKLLRAELGISQEELATASGLTIRNIQGIEGGKTNPTLFTLESLAKALRVTVRSLLTIDRVRVGVSKERFVEAYGSVCEKLPMSASIRDLNGIVLYRNPIFRKMIKLPEEADGTLDLLKLLPPGACELLRAQLECERRGMVSTYVNFYTDKTTGTQNYFRFYPCLILPQKGMTPYFSAMYSATMLDDCEENYHIWVECLIESLKIAK